MAPGSLGGGEGEGVSLCPLLRSDFHAWNSPALGRHVKGEGPGTKAWGGGSILKETLPPPGDMCWGRRERKEEERIPEWLTEGAPFTAFLFMAEE